MVLVAMVHTQEGKVKPRCESIHAELAISPVECQINLQVNPPNPSPLTSLQRMVLAFLALILFVLETASHPTGKAYHRRQAKRIGNRSSVLEVEVERWRVLDEGIRIEVLADGNGLFLHLHHHRLLRDVCWSRVVHGVTLLVIVSTCCH